MMAVAVTPDPDFSVGKPQALFKADPLGSEIVIVSPVKLDLCLGEDRRIDIFILQWHTPEPFRNHTWAKMASQDAEKRGRVLQKFQNWLCNNFDRNQPVRPLFVIAPELSVSIQHMIYLDQLAEQLKRPAVIIAGLEYLEAQQYLDIRQSLREITAMTNWREDIPDGCVVASGAILQVL